MTRTSSARKVEPASLVRHSADAMSYPGLERAGQRLARGLGELLGGLMAASAIVTPAAIRLEQAPSTDGLAVQRLRLEPLKGSVALVMSRLSVMRLVDLYYGGEGTDEIERERLSPTEERFFARIASACCPLLGAALQPFAEIRPAVDEESGPAPGAAAVQAFHVSIAGRPSFDIECRFPMAMLEAVPGLQSAEPTAEGVADSGWQARLMECALDIAIPVRAVFAQPELPLQRLIDLRAGEVIPVCLPPHIDLVVAGLRLARGTAGESGGRAAVCIEQF